MDPTEKARLTGQSITLRTELKAWEKQFAAANNGRKASRDDIKKHPEIVAKHKDYNRLKDILDGKVPPPPPPSAYGQTPRKRKREEVELPVPTRQLVTKTPSKTPSKSEVLPWEVDPYESPSVMRSLFTPSKKSLGPTPQKDGVVLGLFDLLEEQSSSQSKKNDGVTKDDPVGMTPRKKQQDEVYENSKYSKTPASTGKRFMLDAFATPLKIKNLNGQDLKTPSSVSKLHFSTPSFLRRDSQRIQLGPRKDDELGTNISPQLVRVPRKPLVRGLSSILAGLRKIEEEAHDEDLEALREMEAEEAATTANGNKPIANQKKIAAESKEIVLVGDSQSNFPLGGFDDIAKYDSEPEEQTPGLGPDGKPLKVYKKKGQKRTTRRVNLKPTRSKPQLQQSRPTTTQNSSKSSDEESEEGDEQVADAVPETQHLDPEGEAHPPSPSPSIEKFADVRNFDSDTQSEYTASEGGTRYRRPNQEKKKTKKSKTANKDGKVKTAARKVTALANQNFKRLKLRNSGAKGGPGYGSRFRRRK